MMDTRVHLPLMQWFRRSPQQYVSNSWEDRSQVLQSGTNLFCWQRKAHTETTGYLKNLMEYPLEPFTLSVRADNVSEVLSQARRIWEPSWSAAGQWFWDDVLLLVRDFMQLAGQDLATVHLRTMDNDGCTKFHTDGYPLRLFTTYYGRGTEWLPERAVNRHALGTTNKQIVKSATEVRQMAPFEVGILKGGSPDGSSVAKGIVHRSPAIKEHGEKRLVLRVDI